MEVFKKIGSKERFYEIMSGVNKIKLNEDIMGSEGGLADKAVQELISGSLDIEQVNNQVSGNESIVEIVGKDDVGSKFIFKFSVTSNETDQQGVNVINDANIIELTGEMPKYSAKFEMDRNDNRIAELNQKYKQELIDAISEYVEFESDTETVADEMYEEAIRLIDKVPYNKDSEEIQTHKAYADQKPVNPDIRVKSPELEKYIGENVPDDEDKDMFALPPNYSPDDIPKPQDTDDGSTGIDPYEQEPQYDNSQEASPEENELYSRVYDNLVAGGNRFPTPDQIEKEVKKLQGLDKPVEKTRTIPKGAEEFWEGHVVTDISADDVVKHSYDSLSDEKKKQLIFQAQELVDEALGDLKISREQYIKNIQREAIKLYKESLLGNDVGINEDEKKSDYPDPIGKKFKPKSQMPQKKKKSQSVVKLKEDGIPEIDIDDVTTAKEATGDQLSGGLGDDKSPNQFDPDQIARGVKVEMEHTDNPLLAIEIALDHLTEDPNYYGDTGDDPEEMAQTHASQEAEEQQDDELTYELLGFKPHNVGDYANEELDFAAQERNYWDKEDMRQNPEEYGEEPQEPEDPEIDNDGYPKQSGQMKSFDIKEGAVDWQEFYTMATDTSGYNPEFEEKYGNQIDKPHIVDALNRSQDFNTFMRLIKDFEEMDEEKLYENVELARQVLKNRRLNEGMSKEEAVKLLIRHNIK